MDINTIKPTLNAYLRRVGQHVHVTDALVFGSVALGTATPTSDVDLLVLSDDFEHLDPDDRDKLLYRASAGIPYDLHVLGTTPNNYSQASAQTTLGQIRSGATISIL